MNEQVLVLLDSEHKQSLNLQQELYPFDNQTQVYKLLEQPDNIKWPNDVFVNKHNAYLLARFLYLRGFTRKGDTFVNINTLITLEPADVATTGSRKMCKYINSLGTYPDRALQTMLAASVAFDIDPLCFILGHSLYSPWWWFYYSMRPKYANIICWRHEFLLAHLFDQNRVGIGALNSSMEFFKKFLNSKNNVVYDADALTNITWGAFKMDLHPSNNRRWNILNSIASFKLFYAYFLYVLYFWPRRFASGIQYAILGVLSKSHPLIHTILMHISRLYANNSSEDRFLILGLLVPIVNLFHTETSFSILNPRFLGPDFEELTTKQNAITKISVINRTVEQITYETDPVIEEKPRIVLIDLKSLNKTLIVLFNRQLSMKTYSVLGDSIIIETKKKNSFERAGSVKVVDLLTPQVRFIVDNVSISIDTRLTGYWVGRRENIVNRLNLKYSNESKNLKLLNNSQVYWRPPHELLEIVKKPRVLPYLRTNSLNWGAQFVIYKADIGVYYTNNSLINGIDLTGTVDWPSSLVTPEPVNITTPLSIDTTNLQGYIVNEAISSRDLDKSLNNSRLMQRELIVDTTILNLSQGTIQNKIFKKSFDNESWIAYTPGFKWANVAWYIEQVPMYYQNVKYVSPEYPATQTSVAYTPVAQATKAFWPGPLAIAVCVIEGLYVPSVHNVLEPNIDIVSEHPVFMHQCESKIDGTIKLVIFVWASRYLVKAKNITLNLMYNNKQSLLACVHYVSESHKIYNPFAPEYGTKDVKLQYTTPFAPNLPY